MALEKTYEELLASKINPRNYSAVLPIIYNLRKRAKKDYFPSAPSRIIYNAGVVGDGASAVFNSIDSTYGRGEDIVLSGTATYILSDGTTPIVKPAINIVAQIDMNIKNADRNLIPFQAYALASEIASNGAFSFVIPASITEQLSIGTHYVYIDAASPDNNPVRLTASGTSNDPNNNFFNTRSFDIASLQPVLRKGTAVPIFGSSATSYNTSTDNAPYNNGWTLAVSSSQDDSNFSITPLHSIYIYNSALLTIFPGSNTYITGGSGSINFSSLSFTNPALNAIQLGSADNSWQRVWYKTESDKTRIRYEGRAFPSGIPGSPNIVYEVTFFKPDNFRQFIEIRFGVHSRTSGVFGIQNGTGTYVNGGTITANQSYVIKTDNYGANPVIYTGYYIS